MNWLPLPSDFAAALNDAESSDDSRQAVAQLVDLARCRLGFLETIQVDNALSKLDRIDLADALPTTRLALLGSTTVDHLLPSIRVAGLRHGLNLILHAGSFGQYRQEVLAPSAQLSDFAADNVLLAASCAEVIANVATNASKQEADQAINDAVDGMKHLWRAVRESLSATVIQQSVLDVTHPLFGSYDRLYPGAPSRVVALYNDLIATASAENNVLWLDVAARSARDGISYWFDPARWLQGKMEIAPQAAMIYGDLVARLIAAQRGRSRKCLVLDLDNTLWGGVLGDDGIEGIALGQGSAVGEAYLALQHYVESLNRCGIILAVCSRNDEAIAKSAFESHPDMVLALSDIAVFVANWNDKVENLVAIAEQLNIGLDALVFVDDNPVERARVRTSLPDVAVPELPDDPAAFVACISDAGYFETVAMTPDDQLRARQYAENAKRKMLREKVPSLDMFLRDLDMVVAFGPVTSVDLARSAQLINKTNQFNLTGQRLSTQEITSIADHPKNVTLWFRLSDRFGDNGLVSVVVLRPDQSEADALDILNWVMSCRVFGRRLEDEIMNIVVDTVRNLGVRTLFADYTPTGRNGVISELLGNLGFSSRGNKDGESSRWRLDLEDYERRETSIRRSSQ